MCKIMGHVICFFFTIIVVFLTLSVWKGGDVFRDFGKKADGAISNVSKSAGNAADAIKKVADPIIRIVKSWMGNKEVANDKNEDKEEQPKDDKKKIGQPKDKKSDKTGKEKRSN